MTTVQILQSVLKSGGLRVESVSPEMLSSLSGLVGSGLCERLEGPAHGPKGTFYVTAAGCRKLHAHELATVDQPRPRVKRASKPRIPCPDCDGEGKIDGFDKRVRCTMCGGKGDLGPIQWKRLTGE